MGLPLDEKLKFFDDEDALAKLDEHAAERREPAAHARQLGQPQDPRRRRARERAVPRAAWSARSPRSEGRERVGRAHRDRPRRRAQHQLRHRAPRPRPTTTGRRASRCGATAARSIGASDAGAHLDLLASFNYATVVLGKAVRERKLLPLEEAIHLITDVARAALRLQGAGPGRRRAGTPTSSSSIPRPSAATTCACAWTCPAAPAGSTPRPTASSTCS